MNRHDEIKKACAEYHRAHPEVWRYFVQFANELIGRGFKHYSATGIFERIRWHCAKPNVREKDRFKISNNFSPFYARAFMKAYPQHEGFFRTRHQISRDSDAVNRPELRPSDFGDHRTLQ